MIGVVERGWPLKRLLGRLMRLDTVGADFVQAADELRQRGELEAAGSLCARGLERFPGYASGHVVMGEILWEQGRADLAEHQWREALRHHPEHPWAHLRLAQLHLGRGQLNRAMAELELSLLYSPNSPEASALLDRARAAGVIAEADTGPAVHRQARIEALLAAARRCGTAAVVVGEGGEVLGGRLYARQEASGAAGLGATLMLASRPLMARVGAGALRAAWIAGTQGSLQCYELDGVALIAVVQEAGAGRAELARAVNVLRQDTGGEGEVP